MVQSDTPAAKKLPFLKEMELAARGAIWFIVGGAAIGFILAALSLQNARYIYPVEMQVSQVQAPGTTDTSSRGGLSQLSGLASLANVSLPTTQSAQHFNEFIDSLYTRDLADDLAKDQYILVRIFGHDQWDPETHTWHEPPHGMMDKIRDGIRGLLGLAPTVAWHPPNGEQLQGYIADNMGVIQDPRKPYMVTIRITTDSKEFSIYFLNKLVQTADNRLRQKSLNRARVYMQYLEAKLPMVTVAEHRAALAAALSEQEKYEMVASSGTPFAADVFQSPWASNLPSWPVPRQTFMFWIGLGVVLGFGFGFLRYRLRNGGARWLQRAPRFVVKLVG